MPPTKTNDQKSVDLFAKLGQRLINAHNEYADAPVDYGNAGELPPGITGGVARITECKLGTIAEGKTNAGQPFFYAAASCITPKEFKGMRTEGGRTTIMRVLCDKPDRNPPVTLEQEVGWMYNMLGRLGVERKHIDPRNVGATLKALKDAAPYIKFRTYQIPKKAPGAPGYNPQYDGPDAPEPRTNHEWEGFIPDYEPADADDGVADSTGGMAAVAPPVKTPTPPAAVPARNGTAPAAKPVTPPAAPAKPGPGRKVAPPPAPEPEEPAGGSGEDPFDLDTLLAAAQGDENDPDVAAAQGKLTTAAAEAGITDDEISALPDWDAVVAEIKARQGSADEPAADEAIEPSPGDMGKYAPPGPGGKRGKPHECEVTAVDKAKRTCTLQSHDNKKLKPWSNVPWAEFVTE